MTPNGRSESRSTPRSPTRSRSLVFRLCAVAIGVLAGVVLEAALLNLLGYDVGWLVHRLRYRLVPPPAIGIYRSDPESGWAHIPGSAARVETSEFSVLYSIDETGARRVPGAPDDGPLVLFLGDSFTFGHGVEDDEAYPAVVQHHWPGLRVRNRGINGGGTAHAMLALRDDLARGEPVQMAVYGWLVVHNWRNHRNRAWLEQVARVGRRLPLFGTENGHSTFLGLFGPEAGLSRESESFVEREWEITLALVKEMARLCRERDVRFVFLALPARPGAQAHADAIARFVPFLEAEEIEYVDLHGRAAFRGDLFYPVDGHPTPEWHRRVGEAVAAAVSPTGRRSGTSR